jgi:hypothetical protein
VPCHPFHADIFRGDDINPNFIELRLPSEPHGQALDAVLWRDNRPCSFFRGQRRRSVLIFVIRKRFIGGIPACGHCSGETAPATVGERAKRRTGAIALPLFCTSLYFACVCVSQLLVGFPGTKLGSMMRHKSMNSERHCTPNMYTSSYGNDIKNDDAHLYARASCFWHVHLQWNENMCPV